MTGSGVAWSTAIEEASWIGPRLSAFGANRVDSVIPSGFPAYVRLLHPVWHRASAESVRAVRWGEVAAWSGIALERTGQFQDIALPRQAPTAPAPWNSQGPDTGTLPAGDAAVGGGRGPPPTAAPPIGSSAGFVCGMATGGITRFR
jgi:hypothetical protein